MLNLSFGALLFLTLIVLPVYVVFRICLRRITAALALWWGQWQLLGWTLLVVAGVLGWRQWVAMRSS